MRRCEEERMWRWEDVKMRRCEDKKMWRWADVKMSRCEDEQMWRWEGVKIRRFEDEAMWRWADVKMSRCENERVWRWADVKMRRCEDEKVWRWDTDPHYWKNPALRRSREKTTTFRLKKHNFPAQKFTTAAPPQIPRLSWTCSRLGPASPAWAWILCHPLVWPALAPVSVAISGTC